MEYQYIAQILNEDEEVIATVSSFSEEGLLEEMGKSKWTKAVENFEGKIEAELELKAEDAKDEEVERLAELDAVKDTENND